MSLNANKIPGKKFDKPDSLEPGVYPVRLQQIISLGLQPNEYNGEVKEPVYKLRLNYEFLDEFMKDKETGEDILDKPRWINEEIPLYNLSVELAKSTKRYLALDPMKTHKGDWAKLGGTPAMLTLINRPNLKDPEHPYENVAGLSAMRAKEAANARPLQHEVKVFDLDSPDIEVFNSLTDRVQEIIRGNLEYEGSTLQKLCGAPYSVKSSKGGDDHREVKKALVTTAVAIAGADDDGIKW